MACLLPALDASLVSFVGQFIYYKNMPFPNGRNASLHEMGNLKTLQILVELSVKVEMGYDSQDAPHTYLLLC